MGDDELRRQLIQAAEQFPVRSWTRDLQRRAVRRRWVTAGFVVAIGVVAAASVAVAVPLVNASSQAPNSTVGPTSTGGHQSPAASPGGGCASQGHPANFASNSAAGSITVCPGRAPAGIRNLAISSALRTELTAAYVAYKRISPADVAGTGPGSVHYAYDPATDTYWALANFVPSATAPLRVTVGFQDGASWGFFRKVGSGPWQAREGGEPVVCLEVLFFPRAVLTAWSLPTDTAGLGC